MQQPPPSHKALAASGSAAWLPNALASSLYWLEGRRIGAWPLVCEDVVRHNARSRYRHMAYVPSGHVHEASPGVQVRWLLGVPISDRDIGMSLQAACDQAAACFPDWLAPIAADLDRQNGR